MSASYLMVVPVPGYAVSPHRFAIEGAFAEHLRMLKEMLGDNIGKLTLASPQMSAASYQAQRSQLSELDEDTDGIRYRPMFPLETGRIGYWKRLPAVLKAISEEVDRADIVHSGCSMLYRPFELPALLMAHRGGKVTISVADIDNRASPKMKRATGLWSFREYLWTTAVHSTWSHVQQVYASRHFSLVLLKGRTFAADYGKGRPNVRFFLDSAFSATHIITPERLTKKAEIAASGKLPLRVVYFGRLVPYKGIDRMLHAVARAREVGARLHFTIIGDGPSAGELKELCTRLGLDDIVSFPGAIPFGPELFDRLYDQDLLLGAPLAEDTPRSALDAAAAGVPVLAFGTSYYRDLESMGAAVTTVPWPDATRMGDAIAKIASERAELSAAMHRASDFAKDNTQEIWLKRRIDWTLEALAARASRA